MTAWPEPRPIVTNPGGVVDPADLIGRDTEVDRLIRSIATGGAKVLGERRIGKTSILRKLEQSLVGFGATVVRVSAETSDPDVFGRHLLDAIRKPSRLREYLSTHGDAELRVGVGPLGLTFSAHGSSSRHDTDLFATCAEAVQATPGRRLVFLFDEITTLARALEAESAGAAASFFHSLRVPRQEIAGVSVVLAGSIGLHHVLSDMSPVNDLDPVPIGPLAPAAAEFLARCLLLGIGRDAPALARDIALQASGVPFYIHKIVQEVGEGRPVADPGQLAALVDDALRTNRWETEHDLTRIRENFRHDTPVVLALLDMFALASSPMTVDAVLQALAATDLDPRPDRTRILDLLGRLEDDHYLLRVADADVFAHDLQRRMWRVVRRLS